MSAGFKVDGEVFWGTNGAVEAYVEAMEDVACKLFGPDDLLARFFRDELEVFFLGKVVCLDQCLETRDSPTRLLQLLDGATRQLLVGNTFTEYGRAWVDTEIAQLRAKLRQLEAQRRAYEPAGVEPSESPVLPERDAPFGDVEVSETSSTRLGLACGGVATEIGVGHMETRCVRVKIKPGSLDAVREWARTINSRREEAVATLRNELVQIESVFLELAADGDFLIYYMRGLDLTASQKAAGVSEHAIDAYHQNFMRAHTEGGTVLEVLVNLEA